MTKSKQSEKDAWIAHKIAILRQEGKSGDQAVAIAFSMWEQRQKKGKKK